MDSAKYEFILCYYMERVSVSLMKAMPRAIIWLELKCVCAIRHHHIESSRVESSRVEKRREEKRREELNILLSALL